MADARQLRLDSERAFRLARAGGRRFFDELNDLGWDLQLQAQKAQQETQKPEELKNNSDVRKYFLEKPKTFPYLSGDNSKG
jgi:hypothetical protein